jgi:multiphosphoryl transfer protein
MVGIVVVSHSRALAESAVQLARQMAGSAPPTIEIAAGLDDGVLGTDAARVKEAIDRVASVAGVLVVMDLGSAVMSAELAVELREGSGHCPVVLSDAPLVEGLVAAVALAGTGATLSEVAAEASQAARTKTALLGVGLLGVGLGPNERNGAPAPTELEPGPSVPPLAVTEFVISNEHGLHARPAAQFVHTARRFDAEITVRNLSRYGDTVSGRSISALSTLGVVPGDRVEVAASGRQAREVLAAIGALARRNFDEAVAGPGPPASVAAPAGPVAASPGIGIGPKISPFVRVPLVPEPTVSGNSGSASERERLTKAIEVARSELTAIRRRVAVTAGAGEAAIFDTQMMLLDDEDLIGRAQELIDEQGASAAAAWGTAINALCTRFFALADPYGQARAQDVRAVGDQVLGHLAGSAPLSPGSYSGVVVVDDLTPAQAAGLDPARVAGVVMASGSPVSHASIVARSLGIPAVVGAGTDILEVENGTTILLDGSRGTVVVDPAPALAEHYRQESAVQRHRATELLALAGRPAVTADGQLVKVCANGASLDDALQAVRHGADGVGLLRTEILFLDRPEPPGEAEQAAVYLSIARALEGRRLTIRTLDAGGDKPVSYFLARPEANPFLGSRGLRLSLRYPEVFTAQLRAITRTAMHYPVTVLFPMVTAVDELLSARRLLFEAAAQVGCEPGTLPSGMEVGAMAEVPAFALRASAAVPLLDVISIGTNDLAQYTMAAERGNADVASLADPLDPAVLQLIAEVTRAAGSTARVAVCGEMANEPLSALLLTGLGVRELSMTPRAVPAVKQALRAGSAQRASAVAKLALQRGSAASVRALLADLA